jgi:hypothetical protein
MQIYGTLMGSDLLIGGMALLRASWLRPARSAT